MGALKHQRAYDLGSPDGRLPAQPSGRPLAAGCSAHNERVPDTAHPEPTPATVKALYAQAFRCAWPDCQRPLYKQDNTNGERILNSRVAHIHARRPAGPRWIEMAADDNRGPENLVLLCIDHSYEVDTSPDQYPAQLLRQWKQLQVDEYSRVQLNWPLSDAEAGRVLVASSRIVDHHHGDAVIGVVRTVERFALAVRRGRAGPAAQAAAWRTAFATARASFTAWDQDGNPVYAEPPRMETGQLEAALLAALDVVLVCLQPLADHAKVELAAARASRPSAAPWCASVSRDIDAVLIAASRWPAPPGLEDDEQLHDALRALSEASDGLTAAWRGEPASPPPEPLVSPDLSPDPHDPLHSHRDLLDRARPYARVDHHPYNLELRAQLAAAAARAATIAPVPSTLAIDLSATCRLAAAVARNADDDELDVLIERDKHRHPLCAAILMLDVTASVMERDGRPAAAEHASQAMIAAWSTVDWSSSDSWQGNENYGAPMLSAVARRTSSRHVQERLADAFATRPEAVLQFVVACATWNESRNIDDWSLIGFRRGYWQLPPWFPTDAIVAAAQLCIRTSSQHPTRRMTPAPRHYLQTSCGWRDIH